MPALHASTCIHNSLLPILNPQPSTLLATALERAAHCLARLEPRRVFVAKFASRVRVELIQRYVDILDLGP